ncbi:MAG: GntR family transcriptional regulator [Acidobacteriota bacterium]
MRLWLSKHCDVPIREQLTTQIILAVSSGELPALQRLPSTRELARRFRVHSNTISAAYRELASKGWVEFRRGSGVYVRRLKEDVPLDGQLELDQVISAFLTLARSRGFTLKQIRSRVRSWLEFQPPDHFLLIEPDLELRRILQQEIASATGFRVEGVGLEGCAKPSIFAGAAPLALYAWAEEVRGKLPAGSSCIILRSRSVQSELLGKLQDISSDSLIAVVSRWPQFLRWAKAVLEPAGIDPATLSFRNARENGWDTGLNQCRLVICDAVTGPLVPRSCRLLICNLVAESSLVELQELVRQIRDTEPIPAGTPRRPRRTKHGKGPPDRGFTKS